MEAKRIKRSIYTGLTLAGIFLGVAALILLGQTAQNSQEFGRLHNTLLIVNAAAALVLLLLILGNLVRLLRDYRRTTPGARLKARMLAAFVVLAIGPLVIVYLFAIQFLNRGIDTWFDLEMEQGLGDALVLSRSALDVRMRDNLEAAREMARQIANVPSEELLSRLGELGRESGALELTVFGDNDRIVATSTQMPAAQLPLLLPEDIVLQLSQSGEYIGLDPTYDNSYQIRAVISLLPIEPGASQYSLQALFPVGGRLGTLVDSVEQTYTRYGELMFLREPLKYSFTVTLTLVVLLSFLAAVYGAFFFARRLVAPIQSLVTGTRQVAEGDLETRLPPSSHDEIGFLIDSFNGMIQRLAEVREEARISAQQVESERIQLQAILTRLSTGVIAVDPELRLRRVNASAGRILGVDFASCLGVRLQDLAVDHALLQQFMAAFQAHLDSGEREWREQLTLSTDTGRRVLLCACTELPVDASLFGGIVILFDDVTELLQAQRDAAWGEVARRLAHEIKNPLTPIQLSAERIRRRYLGNMKDMEAQVLDRATHTIVQQVEAMRDMVNAFSDYARAPAMSLTRVELNQLIREVAYLYRTQDNRSLVELNLDDQLPEIDADAVRIRQLLHNLIRNAIEALEGRDDAKIGVATALRAFNGKEYVEITVTDNGPGIDPDSLAQIFEPYVTTKKKGTGLGLAIVKKLAEEHGGSVSVENPAGGGARFSVQLPVNRPNIDGRTDERPAADTRREQA